MTDVALIDPAPIDLAIPKEIAKMTNPTASSRATTGSNMSVTAPFALYCFTTIKVAAGAVAVAAAMFGKVDIAGKKAVCILSGGNIDVTILSRVIKRGLMKSGRLCSLCIELVDKPGQLEKVSKIIAAAGGNVTSVHHERGETEDINGCYLRIELETKNFEHINIITKALKDNGLKIV